MPETDHNSGPVKHKALIVVFAVLVVIHLPAAHIPVVYGTDLFHPHDDPDDHFDLVTLLALPELDVKAILLDQGDKQQRRPGAIPLRQMSRLTARAVPSAIGLGRKLASAADDGLEQPAEFQAAVELFLKTLRESPEPVTVIMAGSVRDLAAAWNREPALLLAKIGRVYLNIGSADSRVVEYNVDLDAHAYAAVLRSDLPIYLGFCVPIGQPGSANGLYSTWWKFRQSELLGSVAPGLQNYFIYALQKCDPALLDPLEVLSADLRPWRRLVWEMDRNMWCTASLLHAAGRTVHELDGRWTAAPQSPTPQASASPFEFIPARVQVDDAGKTTFNCRDAKPNVHLFKVVSAEPYAAAMRDCLKEALEAIPVVPLLANAAVPSPRPSILSRGDCSGAYQAFPDLCRLTNGDLLCVFYAGYGHVSLPSPSWPRGGRICLVRSGDEGRTWTAPRVLFDGPSDDRDPHIAQMRDGSLLCSFFTYRPQTNGPTRCDTCLVASTDGGRTWTAEPRVVAAGWPGSAPVRELPDGTRVLGVYREEGASAYGGIIRSTDSGHTWCAPIPIGQGSGVRLDAETDFVPLRDGSLLAALRGDRVNLHFATSRDAGLTWSPVKDSGFPGHCPHFTRLRTGEILLSHRLPKTALHVSRDDGVTWQGPYAIDDTIGAYPSTVELRDGSVLVVYYEEGEHSAIRARRFKLAHTGIEFLDLAP